MTEPQNKSLIHLDEPGLTFGHGQVMENPKDGLMLFGPLADTRGPAELRIGIVGRKEGMGRYRRWVTRINGYIPPERPDAAHHVAYPGFEAIFSCRWPTEPICELAIPDDSLSEALYLDDKHDAIYKTVSLFVEEIKRYIREEEAHVDLWFIVIPEDIFTYGRPQVNVPKELRQESSLKMNLRKARDLQQQPSLFSEVNEAAEIYKYETHFHNQLKARLLDSKAVLQVVRETSLTPEDFKRDDGRPMRRVQDPATLAWNLTTTAYFKTSGRPWKLSDVREGVCYVGLVFKRDMTSLTAGNACCGAQMFLDSGDGLVFKGAVGPWYSEDTREFHLPYEKAEELIGTVVAAYKREHGFPPKELFIHGRTRFNDEEWKGFQASVPEETNLVGVRIREDNTLKLYGPGKEPVLRGTALLQSKRRGYLWTRGYIPRLQTYPGREVPNPLFIEICRGESNLEQVMKDIMGLTKVNFNACIFADGRPVTLRFADRVGDILTATPQAHTLPPLPFKHYI
ncbi:MAG: hypothetical protein AB2535_14285 [Candidatus Thiodiazotropha endolucinida]